jgi:uncharacterized protein YjbI with pentapeptide repeats
VALPASRPPTPPRLEASRERITLTDLTDGIELAEVDVTGDVAGVAAADVEISAARISAMRFTGADLDRIRMVDTVIDDCDLSGVLLTESSLTRVAWRGCRLSGIVFARATLRDVHFVECKLDDASLRMATAERIQFDGCNLRRADLHGARLAGARFFDCDLAGTEFSKASLTGARLHGSTLDGVKGATALRGAVIDSAQVVPLGAALLAALGIVLDDERD